MYNTVMKAFGQVNRAYQAKRRETWKLTQQEKAVKPGDAGREVMPFQLQDADEVAREICEIAKAMITMTSSKDGKEQVPRSAEDQSVIR